MIVPCDGVGPLIMLTEVRAANVRILRSLRFLPTEFDLCSERIGAIGAKKPKKFPTFWSKFVRTFALTSERIIRGPTKDLEKS